MQIAKERQDYRDTMDAIVSTNDAQLSAATRALEAAQSRSMQLEAQLKQSVTGRESDIIRLRDEFELTKSRLNEIVEKSRQETREAVASRDKLTVKVTR